MPGFNTTSRIKTAPELLHWLEKRALGDGCKTAAIATIEARFRTGDSGWRIIQILNSWPEAYRYVLMSLRDGELRITSLSACLIDFETEIDVRLADVCRYDLVAIARGFL